MFATPFLELVMPDAGPVLAELRDLFLARENDQHRYQADRATQHGGVFESRFDLFQWPEEPVQKLTRFCHTAISNLVQQLNRYDAASMAKLDFHYDSWFHVTRKGGFQGLHLHPNASWSGIFCIDAGDAPPDTRKYSGVVRFHDPRVQITMHQDPGNDHLQPPFTTGAFDVHHQPGKLVIMPSYLQHEIFPYMGERPRVIVAFNCWVTVDRSAA